MTLVHVRPELLRWALERAGRDVESLVGRFPRLNEWERGTVRPTLKQLESFAKAVFVPLGFLFLDEPPDEPIPLPDLRTVGARRVHRPSPDLLDTIYICQQRQAWYRDFAESTGAEPCAFVGTARRDQAIEDVASDMRRALQFDLDARRDCPTWTEALRQFLLQADALGVLVMCSGVVLSNNRRKLDPQEFRGFAIADDLAPLVFVNGVDTKAAQMFTLAHELAHLWLGESALSDVGPDSCPSNDVERWCNRVAAELLVPLQVLRGEIGKGSPVGQVPRLAHRFKVSTLVVLRRLLDAKWLSREMFEHAYSEEVSRLRARPTTSGGDFYLTQAVRVSRRFARSLVASTLEGQTLYRDAFRMLGISKESTFDELARKLGYVL